MRPYLLAAAVVLAATVSPASAAADCVAHAGVPQTSGAQVYADGSYTCATPASGMAVTVCVESLRPGSRLVWRTETCSTETAAGLATAVSATTWACVQGGPTLVRTFTFGSNDTGYAYATSPIILAPGAGSCGP